MRPPLRNSAPTVEGVSASCVSLPVGPWVHLLDFLVQRMPGVPREVWLERMSQGRVLNDDGAAMSPAAPYQPHTRVYYYRELAHEPHIPFKEAVLYQDDYLVVADKPHFLPVTPVGRYVQETLLVRLKRQLGLEQLAPVHRIDRETAGLVLFTVRPQDRGVYHALFRERRVNKQYEAIAPWREDLVLPSVHVSRIVPDQQFFRQCEVPGEPNSETQIELLEVHGALARYRLTPLSGKTHQLRVHMNALGRPIVGDHFYPTVRHGPGHIPDDYGQPLQLLARALAFVDPISGAPRFFESRRRLSWP